MSSLRIVHLCNVPLPSENPDFARVAHHPGRWVLNLALAQRTHAGIDARVVMQVPGALYDCHADIEGVPVHFVGAPDRFRSATLFLPDTLRLKRAVLAQTPDLIHAHGTEDAYALAAQACRLPYVITAQGCFFIINRELPPRLVSRERMVQLTEWIALKRAKHVIAKSAYVREELVRAFPNLVIHEIPNTVDPRLLEIPVDRGREIGSLAFVGTVVPRKGVHLIAEALNLIKLDDAKLFERLRLHIFGDLPVRGSIYETNCKAALRDVLGDRVVFHGTIASLEVANALSRIETLLAPSLEEMFGNQFIEALAVGADAIVSEGTAMAENARRLGTGGIVDRNNASGLAAAICRATKMQLKTSEREERRGKLVRFVGPEPVALMHRRLYDQLIGES